MRAQQCCSRHFCPLLAHRLQWLSLIEQVNEWGDQKSVCAETKYKCFGRMRLDQWLQTHNRYLWTSIDYFKNMPRTRPMTHCHEHLQVKMHGQMGLLCDSLWHMAAFTTRFSFYSILFCSLLEAEGRYEGMEGWVGLGCMVWNLQRIQKKIFLKKVFKL